MTLSPRETSQSLEISPATEARVLRAAAGIGMLLALLGAAVLLGWHFEIDTLVRVQPGRVSMKVNAALAFVLLGSSLTLTALARLALTPAVPLAALGRACALLVLLIAGATGAQYLLGVDLHIDQLLAADIGGRAGIHPGRMSPATALCFVLVAATLCTRSFGERFVSLAQLLLLLTVAIAYATVIAYLYGAHQLEGEERLNAMAIHTAAAFLLAGLAGLALHHNHRMIAITLSSSPAGAASRRLLPLVTLGPVVLGWVRWTFLATDWLAGPLGTSILITGAVAITAAVANNLGWSIQHQFSERLRTELREREKSELLAWREKLGASLVHDLRTPLTSLKMTADLLHRVPAPTPEQAHRLCRAVDRAAGRCDRLMRNVLDSARAMSGEVPQLSPQPLELGQVLAAVEESFPGHRGQLHVRCPAGLTGSWDEDALVRVVENLVSNALKYGHPRAPVTVSAKPLDADGAGAMIEIEVHNWGPPIPGRAQEGIFELFSRRENASPGVREGWGIGLTAVRTLVAAMGGEVQVRSDKAHGTFFTVRIPRRCEPRPARNLA